MKFKAMGALVCLALCAPVSACTFSWHHYGPTQTRKLIGEAIGPKVTEEYCKRYNKTHEIVVVTDEYSSSNRTLVHVVVGLRKRGSKDFPANRHSAYKFEDGNFVVAKKYEMAAALAVDTVMDVMSDLDNYVN